MMRFLCACLGSACLLSASPAATLSIRPMNEETLRLSLSADPASYFLLQQTTDLSEFFPYAMALGESPNTWNIYPDTETHNP